MKIKKLSLIIAIVILVGIVAIVTQASRAQFSSGYTSPPASVATMIAGKRISVDYYAPSMHGRKIMGGLVPFDEVWCTGANYATRFTTEANLQIGGLMLPAGSYSIWTIPKQDEWTLIINKQTGQSHLSYDSSRDFGRTKMSVRKLAAPMETFRIELKPDTDNQGTLALLWETTEASIPFTIVR